MNVKKEESNKIYYKCLSFISLLVFISDQFTKLWAEKSFQPGEILPIIDNFFNLTLTYNTGIAFGLFSNLPNIYRILFLVVVTTIALVLLVFFLLKEYEGNKLGQFALALIVGGAIGNILDRVRLGHVIDFIDFYYNNYHWPAFNIADSAICIGCLLYTSDAADE